MAAILKVQSELSLWDRFKNINWLLVFLICLVAGVGFAALYSAAGGDINPWAYRQMIRFAFGLIVMLIVAMVDLRYWYRLAWVFYFGGLGLLLAVEIMGHIGMGAQRWINLGFIQLQPSELMKIAVILVLARYFHRKTYEDMRRLSTLIIPVCIIVAPVGLVLLQPDLGTALMILMASAALIFIAGAPAWLFVLGIVSVLSAIPVIWNFLHDYQKQRVLTFLDPERDPLGAGYHITQSKIALGSGGLEGKGFLEGSQSRLNFLPEKQTDFIFTLWAEEWGFLGGVFLLTLFTMIFFYGMVIAMRARQNFGRYLALGLTINFILYVFINTAMVMGLIPVVGAPLPLVSYGGTSMLAVLFGFGLVISCSVYRYSKVTRV